MLVIQYSMSNMCNSFDIFVRKFFAVLQLFEFPELLTTEATKVEK